MAEYEFNFVVLSIFLYFVWILHMLVWVEKTCSNPSFSVGV